MPDVTVSLGTDHVAVVEIHRSPNNFFDTELIRTLDATYASLDANSDCRSILLCSAGKHFCAGADLSRADPNPAETASALYAAARSLVARETPVVAAVQGAAVGGGLGLAMSADFRVAAPSSRFVANFARLGFHHGFGLSVTLPRVVGQQHAADMLLSGRRVGGEEARRMGLCDHLVEESELRSTARSMAAELARSAPLAVRSIRATLRRDLVASFAAAVDHERAEQQRHRLTADYSEGVAAGAERRSPNFVGA